MQKIYSITENVSVEVIQVIENLYKKLKSNDVYSYVYCGYPLTNIDNSHSFMKGMAITEYGIVILYQNEIEKQNNIRDLIKNLMDSPSLSDKYLSNQIPIITLNVEDIDYSLIFSEDKPKLSIEDIDSINEIIQHVQGLIKNDDREVLNENSLGAIIKNRSVLTKKLDEEQFDTLYRNNNDNLRIRGLAGSGKTILLVKKLAYLHFRDREKRLAYVFYTKSLKQYIETMFKEFYREFEKTKEPDMSKVLIMHAWGNSNVPGFYSTICSKFDVEYKTWSDGDFESACRDCIDKLPQGNINVFDYVFVDEAQDFRINFYKLARKSLNPLGKLIYAYDELQTLNDYNSKMPTKKEIFGEDECLDRNLRYCYRSPNEILVTAHALGLGIYHKNSGGEIEFINYVDDLDVLRGVGYIEESGELRPGKDVVLKRDKLINEVHSNNIITFKGSLEEQYAFVVEEINNLIENEDILTDDLLIIDLDSIKVTENFIKFRDELWKFTDQDGDHVYNTNIVNKDRAISFRLRDSIPYTTIFRAKGNEANIVFILNANKLNMVEMFNRNRIFTAMTRAKFRVYILGDGDYMDEILEEINEVKNKDYKLQFKCLSEQEQRSFKNKLYQDSKKADDMNKILEILNKYKDDPQIYLKLLKEQGQIDDIIKLITSVKDDNKND